MDINRENIGQKTVVESYGSSALGLQIAEAKVMAELKAFLAEADVLDLGVGAGRTTVHLRPICRSYLGIDYSEGMVEHCRKRFDDKEGKTFRLGDARNLDFLGDSSFDFVFFSYNGIDFVDLSDRTKVLLEVYRVLRPGGFFFLSTHNLHFDLRRHHKLSFHLNPLKTWRSLRRFVEFRFYNPDYGSAIRGSQELIRDGSGSFQMKFSYQTASHQKEELEGVGFQGTKVYSQASGDSIGFQIADRSSDPWLHYLARKPE